MSFHCGFEWLRQIVCEKRIEYNTIQDNRKIITTG